jgi:two-component system CheB/CheR fusion protein
MATKSKARGSARPKPVVKPSRKQGEQSASKRTTERGAGTVVGFGASAGGLEAFTEVLTHLPAKTGMALVLVQHLDPKHASVLTSLLARSTSMPVLEIRDGMPVEPNHVYVIPPNANLSISGGHLQLTPRAGSGHQMPIDQFFRSLAEAEGSKAIGVILSGTASDGTLGLKAIKAEGGITFAQDESARYDGMPKSATAAQCVDFVLPPNGIAAELIRLSRHPYLAQAIRQTETPVLDPDFGAVFGILRTATGVDFTYYKHATIRRRILRRMALNHIESPERYTAFVRENPGELQSLFHDVLINVTGFFREPGMFDLLKSRIFPELFRGRTPEPPVRVWVPGCSTGEDVYSICICLLEYMSEKNMEAGLQIFGTDISESVLEKARAGIYPGNIANEVSEDRLRRFFVKVNGTFQIARSVRDMCVFARHNLTKDPPFSKLDLVVCRNVLIYLGTALQQRLMSTFHYALKPSGYLALGISETVGTATDLFDPLDRKQKVYARKAGEAVHLDFARYREVHAEPTPPQPLEWSTSPEFQRKIDQLLLSRYSPPGVVVDAGLRILQFRGHTAPFLQHAAGEANLNLLKMSHPGLGMEVQKLIQEARAKEATVRSKPLQMPVNGGPRQVRISVTPVKLSAASEAYYVVLFEEPGPAEAVGKSRSRKTGKALPAPPSGRQKELEQELSATKLYLQSVVEEQEATTEELKSANEEIQSSNEELQSTNEELLTAKEELQSTNEELTTLNEEMMSRNTELAQINNDLTNLLSSINIAIVMVGNDLRIRRFTPQAEKLLNLVPTDVGRLISDFKPKINVPDLEELFLDVIDNLKIREAEVQDREGRFYSMWIRPYRTTDNKIEGAVMSLFDVTDRMHVAELRYRRMFETARDGILIVEAQSGELLEANPFFVKLLAYSQQEMIGRRLRDVGMFNPTDLQDMTAHVANDETWRRKVALASRSGDRIDVEIVANAYDEGEKRVIQFNVRDSRGRPPV